MDYLQQSFSVKFEYRIYFTESLFEPGNPLFHQFLEKGLMTGVRQKIFFVIDQNLSDVHPQLLATITQYMEAHPAVQLAGMLLIPGGEACKNDPALVDEILQTVDKAGIDRHSYLAAIGGGAVLDLA